MFIYTALGDSITYGYSASSPELAYPRKVITALRSSYHDAYGHLLARPGWSSLSLLYAIERNPFAIRNSTVISIWIGGNDLIYAGLAGLQGGIKDTVEKALHGYKQDVMMIVEKIRSISKARIILCTQYNPFPNSLLAVQAIARLNHITSATAARQRTLLAPVHQWFAGKQAYLISNYSGGRIDRKLPRPLPIHPNDLGHQIIAHELIPYIMM